MAHKKLNPLDRVLAALAQLRNDPSSSSAHFFRTSERRLGAWMAAQELHPRGKQRKVLGFLDELRRRSGKLRDAEVLQERLKELASTSPDAEPIAAKLQRSAEKHRAKLQELLASDRVQAVEELLASWLAEFSETVNRSSPELLEKAIEDYAAFVALRRELDEDSLHDYRLACKEFRYTAELAGEMPEAKRMIEHWKSVQDAIGEWHDWLVLEQVARKAIKKPKRSELVQTIGAKAEEKLLLAAQAAEAAERALLKRHVHHIGRVESHSRSATA